MNNGFIRMVVLILVALFLLSYFHVDLRSLDLSFIQHIWYDYIKTPLIFILNYILKLIE